MTFPTNRAPLVLANGLPQQLQSDSAVLAWGADMRGYWSKIGYDLLGLISPCRILSDDFMYFGTPTVPAGTISVTGGTASSVTLNNDHTVTLLSDTHNGDNANLLQEYNAKLFSGRPDQTKWYLATEFAVTSAISNTTTAVIQLADSANTHNCMFGVRGTASTAHFYGLAGTNTIDTGVAIDTNPHIYEMYQKSGVGGDVYFRFDGVDIGHITIDNAALWVAGAFYKHHINTGAVTGTQRTMVVYWHTCVLANR